MALKLEYNSYGGFDQYYANFKKYCDKMVEADQPLSDIQKKTFFKNGIVDTDYNAKKDYCSRLGFSETVLELRTKATKLGSLSSRSVKQNRRRHNLQQKQEDTDTKPVSYTHLTLPTKA